MHPLSAQQRLWSDWADVQADLSRRWAHMPFCRFLSCTGSYEIPYGPYQAKRGLRASRACAKAHQSICSPFIHSVVSSDSVSGQQRPRSDCADAQSDLGLRCPHMLEDSFLHGAAHITGPHSVAQGLIRPSKNKYVFRVTLPYLIFSSWNLSIFFQFYLDKIPMLNIRTSTSQQTV